VIRGLEFTRLGEIKGVRRQFYSTGGVLSTLWTGYVAVWLKRAIVIPSRTCAPSLGFRKQHPRFASSSDRYEQLNGVHIDETMFKRSTFAHRFSCTELLFRLRIEYVVGLYMIIRYYRYLIQGSGKRDIRRQRLHIILSATTTLSKVGRIRDPPQQLGRPLGGVDLRTTLSGLERRDELSNKKCSE